MPKNKIKVNKYLSEQKDLLKDFLYQNKGKTVMIDAPTGAGKTKVISQIFHESPKNEFNFLIVPNRVQAEQNASDNNYPLFPIISKTNLQIRKDNFKNSYSAVFDKCSELRDDLKTFKPDANINVIIDEFHMLSASSLYRKESVEGVLKLAEYAKKTNGYCGYMSATTKYERAINFDDKIYFEVEKRDFVDNITILVNRSKKPIKDVTKALVLKSNNAIIRYNNKEEQKLICESISNTSNKNVAYINADEKTYILINGKKEYKNNIYGAIIENGVIPNNVNYLFTTSLLDCGTSITESKMEDAFYIINDSNQLNINSIIQFANRIRHHFKNFYILIGDNYFTDEPFHSFSRLYVDERRNVLECEKVYKNIWNQTKAMPNQTNKWKVNKMKDYLGYKDSWDCNCNLNSIFFDEEKQEVYINELAYNLYIQNLYNKQFFYHIDNLKSELEKSFNKKISIEYIDYINTDKIDMRAIKEERIKEKQIVIDCLKTLTRDTCYKLYDYLKEDAEIEESLKPIFENQEYKKYLKKANSLGISSYNIWNLLQDESKTKREIKTFFLEQQIKNNNRQFAIPQFANIEKPIYDNISIKEQAIILRELYQINKSGNNLKRITITDNVLKNLTFKINQECKKNMTFKEVLNLIKMIFVIVETDSGKLIIKSIKC